MDFVDSAATLAPRLVGATLVVDEGTDHAVRVRIVEVEAYLGEGDAASHAGRGPTRRSAVMFGEPGHLYVYLSYGMHHCANLVCSPRGTASAVLLRAAEVVEGESVVRARRGDVPGARLLSGPGNLCRGLGISLEDNAADLGRGGRFALLAAAGTPRVASGPRIGITRAVDVPLRFWDVDSPAVSGARIPPNRRGPAQRPVLGFCRISSGDPASDRVL